MSDLQTARSHALMLTAGPSGAVDITGISGTHFLGWNHAELSGRSFYDLVHPDDLHTTERQIDLARSSGMPATFVNRYRNKEGTYSTIAWTIMSDPQYMQATGRDITVTMDAMSEWGMHRSALERLQKMDALGQLLGGTSHEINNLMQSIVASLELTRKLIIARRPEETEKFVAKALVSAQRAAALNHRLAVFTAHQTSQPTTISVGALVEGMRDMLQAAMGNSIKMEFLLSPGLWEVWCDANQLEHAIVNLVVNARDAMPNGGTVIVAVSNSSIRQMADVQDMSERQYVSIAVNDTGTGMNEALCDRVFEPFVTANTSHQGIGLGLTWVRHFARAYGGDATITSEGDCGTTVTVYLPRSGGQ